jgi:hypothetical protein
MSNPRACYIGRPENTLRPHTGSDENNLDVFPRSKTVPSRVMQVGLDSQVCFLLRRNEIAGSRAYPRSVPLIGNYVDGSKRPAAPYLRYTVIQKVGTAQLVINLG